MKNGQTVKGHGKESDHPGYTEGPVRAFLKF